MCNSNDIIKKTYVWLKDLSSLKKIIVNMLEQVHNNMDDVYILVDNLKDIFYTIKDHLILLGKSHQINYGTPGLSTSTRNQLKDFQDIIYKALDEINLYSGEKSVGQLTPNENIVYIKKIAFDVGKISNRLQLIYDSLNSWVTELEQDSKMSEMSTSDFNKNNKDLFKQTRNDNYYRKSLYSRKNVITKDKQYYLLQDNEHYGVIRAPVSLLSHSIQSIVIHKLKKLGYTIFEYGDKYLFVDNAHILGVSINMANIIIDDNMTKIDTINNVMKDSLESINMYYKKKYNMIPFMVKNETHHYCLLFLDSIPIKDISIRKWKFK